MSKSVRYHEMYKIFNDYIAISTLEGSFTPHDIFVNRLLNVNRYCITSKGIPAFRNNKTILVCTNVLYMFH